MDGQTRDRAGTRRHRRFPWLSAAIGLMAMSAPIPTGAMQMSIAIPDTELEQITEPGDAAQRNGDLRTAISAYRAAYYQLTPEDQLSLVGAHVVHKTMLAYQRLWTELSDPDVLHNQLRFVTEFLDAVSHDRSARRTIGEELMRELERIQTGVVQTLDSLTAPSLPVRPPTPVSSDSAQTTPARSTASSGSHPPDPPPPDPSRPPPGLDRWGVGLIASGGGLAVLGAGLMVVGWGTNAAALQRVDQAVVDGATHLQEGKPDRARYLAQTRAQARPWLMSGGIALGLGVGVILAAAIRISIRRQPRSVGLRSSSPPGGVGATRWSVHGFNVYF